MNNCKTCKHWIRVRPEKNLGAVFAEGGWCESKNIREGGGNFTEHKRDQLVYSYDEGGCFWTGPDFGCVHHEAK